MFLLTPFFAIMRVGDLHWVCWGPGQQEGDPQLWNRQEKGFPLSDAIFHPRILMGNMNAASALLESRAEITAV